MTLKKLISCTLILFAVSRCSTNRINDPIQDNYLTYLFLTTADLPCNPRTYTNPFDFTDPQGDVKAGFLNIPNEGVGHLDLISGHVQENPDNASFQLGLNSVPETININTSSNPNSPEYEWNYLFQGENSFKIGITHFPDEYRKRFLS